MYKIHKIQLDEELDGDIIQWLDSIPRSRKSELTRHALRYYMTATSDGDMFKMVKSEVAPPKVELDQTHVSEKESVVNEVKAKEVVLDELEQVEVEEKPVVKPKVKSKASKGEKPKIFGAMPNV